MWEGSLLVNKDVLLLFFCAISFAIQGGPSRKRQRQADLSDGVGVRDSYEGGTSKQYKSLLSRIENHKMTWGAGGEVSSETLGPCTGWGSLGRLVTRVFLTLKTLTDEELSKIVESLVVVRGEQDFEVYRVVSCIQYLLMEQTLELEEAVRLQSALVFVAERGLFSWNVLGIILEIQNDLAEWACEDDGEFLGCSWFSSRHSYDELLHIQGRLIPAVLRARNAAPSADVGAGFAKIFEAQGPFVMTIVDAQRDGGVQSSHKLKRGLRDCAKIHVMVLSELMSATQNVQGSAQAMAELLYEDGKGDWVLSMAFDDHAKISEKLVAEPGLWRESVHMQETFFSFVLLLASNENFEWDLQRLFSPLEEVLRSLVQSLKGQPARKAQVLLKRLLEIQNLVVERVVRYSRDLSQKDRQRCMQRIVAFQEQLALCVEIQPEGAVRESLKTLMMKQSHLVEDLMRSTEGDLGRNSCVIS